MIEAAAHHKMVSDFEAVELYRRLHDAARGPVQ